MRHILRSSALRPILFSALVTGVPLAALFALQWRFMDQLQVATTDVLRQESDAAADDLAQKIRRDFGWPAFNLLERIDHGDVRRLTFASVVRTVDERADHLRFVDRVFVWSGNQRATEAIDGCDPAEGPRVYFLAIRRSAASESASGVVTCDPRLATAVLAKGLQLAQLRSSFTLADEVVGGHAYQVVYHFLYDQTEERLGLRAFVGFTIDAEYLREEYFPKVVAESTGPTRPVHVALPVLAASILDDGGQEIYRSGRSLLTQFDGQARFPFVFFDTELLESLSPVQRQVRYWTVRTGYAEGDVSTFVSGRIRQQRALWLVMGLVAIAGVALTVRATAREMRLAELKSEFVASMSHELKTPLAKIQLFAETLESGRTRTPERAQEYFTIIRGQALKLGYLIGMMLDFARIEAGVRQYPLEELDLQPVIASALASFQDELTLKEFQIETSFAAREIPVRGNSGGLQQLFGNLISNAIKYSATERYLFIGVRTDRGDAVVDVTDHGIGIPRSEHRRIFRKFYRVSNLSARPNTTGSGLGLAIVAHVARAHRATVSVASAPGRGATFTVRMPLIEQEEAAS